MAKAKTTTYWSDATALGTPKSVAEAARTARRNGAMGFIPSLEAFSYVATAPEAGEPSVVGKRHQPFGFDAEGEGRMPYNTLPVRVQRFAFKTYSQAPDLDDAEFQSRLGQHFFGADSTPTLVADLLELQRIWSFESTWYWPSPLLDPAFFATHGARLKWDQEKRATYDAHLATLKAIAERYQGAINPTAQEMHRLATMVVARWEQNRRTPSTSADR